MGIKDPSRIYQLEDLAQGQVMFAATGVTDGSLLRGVRFLGGAASTHSVVMRSKSGTIRFIEARHFFDRKPAYDWMQRELVRPFYATDNERLPQYETERVLRERAAGIAAIDVRLGWQLENVQARHDGVSARIVRADGSGAELLAADYLVGCDGSRSAVREQMGIGQNLSDHDRLMVLLVFRSQGLHELLWSRFPGKSYFSVLHPALEGYWRFFGRVDLAPTWFFHAPVPRGTTEDNTDFRRLLHEAAGAAFDVEFQHIGFWDLRFAVARTYQHGRVMLAGDAAHSHPPYGGYGVNTGFEDARNLGWKLAAALQGWAGPGLLPSYDAERRPVFESTARDFIFQAPWYAFFPGMAIVILVFSLNLVGDGLRNRALALGHVLVGLFRQSRRGGGRRDRRRSDRRRRACRHDLADGVDGNRLGASGCPCRDSGRARRQGEDLAR